MYNIQNLIFLSILWWVHEIKILIEMKKLLSKIAPKMSWSVENIIRRLKNWFMILNDFDKERHIYSEEERKNYFLW